VFPVVVQESRARAAPEGDDPRSRAQDVRVLLGRYRAKWGEYERTTATALNAYIGPVMAKYLGNLDRQLKASGYAQPLQITQCGGGSISVDHAMGSPLPDARLRPGVGGDRVAVPRQAHGPAETSSPPTWAARPSMSASSTAGSPSIPSSRTWCSTNTSAQGRHPGDRLGRRSLARVDAASKTLAVGPESAGADPGPACYGKGGTVATVTDADVVLGYINPDNFPRRPHHPRQEEVGRSRAAGRGRPRAVALPGGGGDRADRRVQDGRHHPQDDRRKGIRPARFRALRLRRRGTGARGRVARSSACRRS